MYKPSAPFSAALELLVPESYQIKQGVRLPVFPATGVSFFGSFKTYGGTDRVENGVYSVIDTATVETWYRPEFRNDCRVRVAGTDKVYEIEGEPEDIELRHQYLRIKLRRVKG